MVRSLTTLLCVLLVQCAAGQVTVLRWHGEQMYSGTFYLGGSVAVTTGDSSIVFWDAATGQALRNVNVHCESMGSAVCSPDGRQLAVGDHAVGLYALLWQHGVDGGYRSGTLSPLCNGLSALCFSPDGSIIAGTGDLDFGGYLMGTDSLNYLCCTGIGTTTFSHDSRLFAEGTGYYYPCLLRDAKKQRVVDTIVPGVPYFSHDDSRILISSGQRDIRTLNQVLIYSVGAHAVVDSFPANATAPVRLALFSPNDSIILSISSDSALTLWDAASLTPTHALRIAGAKVDNTSIPQYENCNGSFGACFSPDGTRVLSVHTDGTARVWNAATGELLHTLAGHNGTISIAMFDSAGTHVLTVGTDASARIWGPTYTSLTSDVREATQPRFFKVEFFPNPVNIGATIRWEIPPESPMREVAVYDCLGRCVARREIVANETSGVLPCPSAAPGVYEVMLSGPSGVLEGRVVVLQ